MTYNKPEVTVLGNAIRMIQECPSKGGGTFDDTCSQNGPASAYDLDE